MDDERKSLVWQALKKLPDSERELIEYFLNGVSREVVAEKLGISPVATRKRYDRAFQRLAHVARELKHHQY